MLNPTSVHVHRAPSSPFRLTCPRPRGNLTPATLKGLPKTPGSGGVCDARPICVPVVNSRHRTSRAPHAVFLPEQHWQLDTPCELNNKDSEIPAAFSGHAPLCCASMIRLGQDGVGGAAYGSGDRASRLGHLGLLKIKARGSGSRVRVGLPV